MGTAFIQNFDTPKKSTEKEFNSEDYGIPKDKIISWTDFVSREGWYWKSNHKEEHWNGFGDKVWGKIKRNFIGGYFPVYKSNGDIRSEADVLPTQHKQSPVFCHASDILETSFHINKLEISEYNPKIKKQLTEKFSYKTKLNNVEPNKSLPEGFKKIFARANIKYNNNNNEESRKYYRVAMRECDGNITEHNTNIEAIQNNFKEQIEWLQALNDYSSFLDTSDEKKKFIRINGEITKDCVQTGKIKSAGNFNL